MVLTAKITSEAVAQPRCVGSILMRLHSPRAALAQDLAEEFPRVHAMRRVVRAGIHAARLLQMRAKVTGSRLLLDHRFFAPGVLGIVAHHGKRVQVDVAVRAVPRAQPAAYAPVLDDYFQRIAAPDRADRAAHHAKRIAALPA